jgi:hypothetical protein
MDEPQAIKLLGELSRYAPMDRLTGTAREVEESRVRFESSGNLSPMYDRLWMAEPWRKITISKTPDASSWVVVLEHGINAEGARVKRFEVVCRDGRWLVSRTGDESAWETPPAALPGQSGPLTPELASALVREAKRLSGAWRQTVLAGTELARGLAADRNTVWGQKHDPAGWDKIRPSLTLATQDADQVVGESAPAGEKVRFQRVDGVWRITDHTFEGEWAGAPPGTPAPFGTAAMFNARLFGILPGDAPERVTEILGSPDSVQTTEHGALWAYKPRGIDILIGPESRVAEIRASSGATARGIPVGAPVGVVEKAFGESPTHSYVGGTYALTFEVVDGVVTAIVSRK